MSISTSNPSGLSAGGGRLAPRAGVAPSWSSDESVSDSLDSLDSLTGR